MWNTLKEAIEFTFLILFEKSERCNLFICINPKSKIVTQTAIEHVSAWECQFLYTLPATFFNFGFIPSLSVFLAGRVSPKLVEYILLICTAGYKKLSTKPVNRCT